MDDYEEMTLPNGSKRCAYRVTSVDFCGVHGTGVLMCSEDLKNGQITEMDEELKKLHRTVTKTNERLSLLRSEFVVPV